MILPLVGTSDGSYECPYCPRLSRFVPAVGMPQIPGRIDNIANTLLEHRYVRKALVFLAVPNKRVVDRDPEDATCPGNQGDLTEICPERAEKFLRHPCRTEHPSALCAVRDRDSRSVPTHTERLSTGNGEAPATMVESAGASAQIGDGGYRSAQSPSQGNWRTT